jgi:hypothetical protein
MFSKYFVKIKESEEGSPSVSKSALDNHCGLPTTLPKPGNIENKENGSVRPTNKAKGGWTSKLMIKARKRGEHWC